MGVASQASKAPAELSGGQQQRVAIARSLVHDPPLVWADEPTGNLDGETSAEVMDLVTQLNRSTGKTFVIVTHDVSITERCHRTIHMASGRVVAPDDAPAAKAKPGRGRPVGGRKR